MAFHAGMKVVCVDAGPDLNGSPLNVTEGSVYTVNAVDICGPDCCGLVLDGVDLHLGRWSHCSLRFRPLVDRKTSIEIFTAMLKPSQVDA